MAARDLAIGLLLGGGGGSTSLLQEFLRYSIKLGEAPINSTYRFELHAIIVNPTDYPQKVIDDTGCDIGTYRGIDIQPDPVSSMPGLTTYAIGLYAYAVAFEGSTPLFAIYMQYPWSYNLFTQGGIDHEGNPKLGPNEVVQVDISSIYINATNLSLWLPGQTSIQWKFYDLDNPSSYPNFNMHIIYNRWDYDWLYDQNNDPYFFIGAVRQEEYTYSISGSFGRPVINKTTITDLSEDEFDDKMYDIMKAISDEMGIDCPQKCSWGRITDGQLD